MFVFGISVPMSFGYTLLAAATGGYVLTSILLLNYPELLHKKKKKSFHSAHISHRGGQYHFYFKLLEIKLFSVD